MFEQNSETFIFKSFKVLLTLKVSQNKGRLNFNKEIC